MEQIQPPGTLKSIGLIARFELVRLFQTPRGLLSLAAFAVIWYFILKELILRASKFVTIPGFKESISEMFGQTGLANLLQWPIAEYIVFWVFALLLFPIFTTTIAADQTSSDRARGTLRFLTLRASRDAVYFGRFAGQLIIQALLVLGVLSATYAMAVWNNHDNWRIALLVSLVMGINLLIVVLPFTAMMAFFSSAVRSGKLAVTLAIVCWGGALVLFGYLTYKVPSLDFLFYLLPGQQLPGLIQANNWQTLEHAFAPIFQTIAFLLAGRLVLQRSSL